MSWTPDAIFIGMYNDYMGSSLGSRGLESIGDSVQNGAAIHADKLGDSVQNGAATLGRDLKEGIVASGFLMAIGIVISNFPFLNFGDPDPKRYI